MPGRTVLDPQLSAENRDEGMRRVFHSADPAWISWARQCVIWTAQTFEDFTSDDVWTYAGLQKPIEARALGPVISTLARERIIEPTGEYRTTAQATRNAAPVRVWRLRET